MKIKELEERINKRLVEKGLTIKEGAVRNYTFKNTVELCINAELKLLKEEISNIDLGWLHSGNHYYGESPNNFYCDVDLVFNGVHYIGYSFKIEFKVTKKRVKPYYTTTWYTEGIKVIIKDYDENTEIQDIIDTKVKDIKIYEKIREEERIKAKEEAKRKELEHKKFNEERTKELLDYIHKNNLDTEEFKEMARKYILYCQGNV